MYMFKSIIQAGCYLRDNYAYNDYNNMDTIRNLEKYATKKTVKIKQVKV